MRNKVNSKDKVHPVIALPINKLVPLPNNPFDLYEGQRLEDLVESTEVIC